MNPSIIGIASDHAGYELKEALKGALERRGLEVRDFGPESQGGCDYPDFGGRLARAVSEGELARGVLICGTGTGMAIVANKFPGVRAALCHNEFTARVARAHNDANVLCLGGRVLAKELAEEVLGVWLETPFEGGRHGRRVEKIGALEREALSRGRTRGEPGSPARPAAVEPDREAVPGRRS
ncbi:MAG: ribose 5-phosphate isomerase B [Nitrospinota bacterium]